MAKNDLLNQAKKLSQDNQALQNWFSSLSSEEQTQLMEQFHKFAHEELIPMFHAIIAGIQSCIEIFLKQWSEINNILEEYGVERYDTT